MPWIRLLQHRFGGTGALAGHAVGNLLLAGLMEILDDPVRALDEVARLIGARGRVLPMACEPLDIEAEVTGLEDDDPQRAHRIRGQVAVASTPGRVRRVRLLPDRPQACAEALAAVRSADLLLLGPGSWFTSVLPHLLMPELRDALVSSPARRVIVLNLAPEPGETAGFSPEQHLAVLAEHAPDLRVDAVLADVGSVPMPDRLHRAAAGLLAPGGRVHLAPVAAADPTTPRHDPAALADALAVVIADPAADPAAGPRLSRAPRCRREPGGDAGRDEQGGRHGVDQQRHGVEVLHVAMTAAVKDELSRLAVSKPCCRRAEVAALLRFAGGLHIVGGRVVVEAELDTGSVARRLRRDIHELYGHVCEAHVISAGGLRRSARYVIRVVRDGEGLARQTGLLDARGRPVRGLPPPVVSGGVCDAEAAWRGAFLAHGSLTEPGRSSALEVTCPGPEAALALVGAARRLGVTAKAREVRGADRVVIRDGDAISALLTRMGAHESMLAWEERRMRREVRATANRLANFDDANLRRSARAAVAAAARVARALDILGDDVPPHLLAAGRLRVEHTQASLEELGQLADPPMTKDAVAGRIRRLLHMADKRAADLGIPDTESAVTAEMLEEA